MFYSRFMLFPTFKKTYLVEGGGGGRQNLGTVGIYIQYILYSLVQIFYLKCGGGG